MTYSRATPTPRYCESPEVDVGRPVSIESARGRSGCELRSSVSIRVSSLRDGSDFPTIPPSVSHYVGASGNDRGCLNPGDQQ